MAEVPEVAQKSQVTCDQGDAWLEKETCFIKWVLLICYLCTSHFFIKFQLCFFQIIYSYLLFIYFSFYFVIVTCFSSFSQYLRAGLHKHLQVSFGVSGL